MKSQNANNIQTIKRYDYQKLEHGTLERSSNRTFEHLNIPMFQCSSGKLRYVKWPGLGWSLSSMQTLVCHIFVLVHSVSGKRAVPASPLRHAAARGRSRAPRFFRRQCRRGATHTSAPGSIRTSRRPGSGRPPKEAATRARPRPRLASAQQTG